MYPAVQLPFLCVRQGYSGMYLCGHVTKSTSFCSQNDKGARGSTVSEIIFTRLNCLDEKFLHFIVLIYNTHGPSEKVCSSVQLSSIQE